MKKVLVLLIVVLSFSFVGKAQTGFVGGGLTLFFSDGLLYQSTIHGGYEFNDKIAVMAMVGIVAIGQDRYSYVSGTTGSYLRYTTWHNNVIYLDLKPAIELAFSDYISVADIAVVPSMRFRCSTHWEVFSDIGAFGVRYMEGVWSPRIGFSNITAVMGVNYRF